MTLAKPKIERLCIICKCIFFVTIESQKLCCSKICAKLRKARTDAIFEENNKEKRLEQKRTLYRIDINKNREIGRNKTKQLLLNNPIYKEKQKQNCRKQYYDNREQRLKYRLEYYLEHRDMYLQYSKEWRQQNPEKCSFYHTKQRSRDPVDEETIRLIYNLFDYKCMFCGCNKKLSLEHLIAIKKGGSNDFENLGISCRSCNSSKGKKTLVEFMEWRERLRN